MPFVEVLSLNFLLNISYRDFVENRDQWGQKETDGEYCVLQRRETGQHWAFWPLMTRAQLILDWKDKHQIKKKIWGRIIISQETPNISFPGPGREASILPEWIREEGTSAFQDTKIHEVIIFSGICQSELGIRRPKRKPWSIGPGCGQFCGFGVCVVILLLSSHPSRTEGGLSVALSKVKSLWVLFADNDLQTSMAWKILNLCPNAVLNSQSGVDKCQTPGKELCRFSTSPSEIL